MQSIVIVMIALHTVSKCMKNNCGRRNLMNMEVDPELMDCWNKMVLKEKQLEDAQEVIEALKEQVKSLKRGYESTEDE